MTIEIKKFGEILTSRPAGREAYLSAKAYILPKDENEKIIMDFNGVKVLAPSWADEFVTKVMFEYQNKVEFLNTENNSIKETFKILGIAV